MQLTASPKKNPDVGKYDMRDKKQHTNIRSTYK